MIVLGEGLPQGRQGAHAIVALSSRCGMGPKPLRGPPSGEKLRQAYDEESFQKKGNLLPDDTICSTHFLGGAELLHEDSALCGLCRRTWGLMTSR